MTVEIKLCNINRITKQNRIINAITIELIILWIILGKLVGLLVCGLRGIVPSAASRAPKTHPTEHSGTGRLCLGDADCVCDWHSVLYLRRLSVSIEARYEGTARLWT